MQQSDPEDVAHVKEVMETLVEARKADFTQTEIAEFMGIAQGRVSDIETVKWNERVRFRTVMCYARAIGKKIRITVEDA